MLLTPPLTEVEGQSFFTILPATTEAVRQAVLDTRGWLDTLDLLQDDLCNLEIMLAEALNNIVEHSNAPEGALIDLNVEVGQRRAICWIRDFGMPCDVLTKPIAAARPESAKIALLPEGGFGVALIQSIASEIEYLPVERGNFVMLTMPLTTNPVQIYRNQRNCPKDSTNQSKSRRH